MSREAGTCVQTIYNAYASTNVTTAAYVVLDTSLNSRVSHAEIFDSSGSILKLAVGGAGAEVDVIHIVPGGNGRIPLVLSEGQRLSIKAVDATAATGHLIINFYA